jgi:uroporphyrinogen-III synthase
MSARLLLTRPLDSAQDFAQAARDAGWKGPILIAPLMAIVPRALPAGGLDGVGSVILTSQHAVGALAQAPRDLPLFCVGPRTVQAARAAGFSRIHQGAGDGAALLADLLAHPPAQPILHLHGAHLALDLAARLRDAGLRAQSAVVYTQDAVPLDAQGRACLADAGDVVIPVFSPRSARLLGAAVAQIPDLGAALHLLALSPAVAQALAEVPRASLRCADQPDGGALLTMLRAVQAELEASANPR